MSFEFKTWSFDAEKGQLSLNYHDSQFGAFCEQFYFPSFQQTDLVQAYKKRQCAIDKAIEQLFWMAGVSYYKTQLSKSLYFQSVKPNPKQAAWLNRTWQSGLAELAHQNDLPWLSYIDFPSQIETEGRVQKQQLKPRSLVAIGGGKDSLVSIDFLKQQGEAMCLFQVGNSKFIVDMAQHTGCDLLQIKRRVEPRLKQANESGAYNGHVPITAINSCVATVAALLYDFDAIVFSNERSADVGNVQSENGEWVNHQYSKSFEYEQAFQELIHQNVATDLHCFSLLRPFSELAIVQKFSRLTHYFPHFSSCNRNFHLAGSKNVVGHWCGECPKCAFVFLMLAVFLKPKDLSEIFAKNLLDESGLIELFAALLGFSGIKPFECVGETEESRWALQAISEQAQWSGSLIVQHFAEQMSHIPQPSEAELFKASERHLIPEIRKFRNILFDQNLL